MRIDEQGSASGASSGGERSRLRLQIAVVALLAVFSVGVLAVGAQDESSLGDVARKARADRTKQRETTPATTEANRLAAELEQEQDETAAAPKGFQSYSAEGYWVAVPSPFSVEGRDENGVLLATEDITGVTTKIFAASPIPISAHPGDIEFQELARSFWRPYGSISCEKHKPGTPEHRCSVSGTLFEHQFNGNARFIEGENRIVPVVCFATTLFKDDLDYSIRHRTREELDNLRADGLRNMGRRDMAYASYRLCGAVLDSIRLKEQSGKPHATKPRILAAKALAPVEGGAGEGPSLGDLARETRRGAAQGARAKISVQAEDTINRAPAGFRVHSSKRCRQQCWQETFFLPENARHVKGGNSENVYVSTLDDTTSLVVYFGSTEVSNLYSEYGNAQGVAQRWIHAQFDSGSKPIQVTRTMNGREVTILRSRLTANMKSWIEEDVAIGTDGVNMSIGCIAREDRFADAESICSTIYESWQLHQ